MIPMCSSRRSPRPFTAGIPPILRREAQSAVSTPQLTAGQGLQQPATSLCWRRWDSALGDGGRSRQDGRTLGLRVCPSPVGGSLAGPSEGVPAPANPSCCGIQQLSQPAHKFKVGSPRLPRGPSHETQEHTHAHTHIRMHTCNLYTHAHTGTLAVHSCTQHAHTLAHTSIHTHTHTPRQGLKGSWVQSGGWITSHSPRPTHAWPKVVSEVTRSSSCPKATMTPDPPGPGSAPCTPCTAELTCAACHPSRPCADPTNTRRV